MTDIAPPPPAPRLRTGLIRLMLPVLGLVAGLATAYLGLWSPLSMFGNSTAGAAQDAGPAVAFVDVPRIVLTVPGDRTQTLALTVMIEIDSGSADLARALMPRILDSYNGFLTQIDPVAFGRRGILEIIRAELATRTRFILGDAAVRDLLITEFRIQ